MEKRNETEKGQRKLNCVCEREILKERKKGGLTMCGARDPL